jgi:hypothetical protein
VPLDVTLLDERGEHLRGLPDPTGRTFDAAGDFDRLLDLGKALPVWSSVDRYGETRVSGQLVTVLASELDHLEVVANAGPERRGLARLRVMVERCRHDGRLVLLFMGD